MEKYKILPRDFVNVDETPMFWEFLPKKIVFKKGEKVVPGRNSSQNHKRSTLILACNAQGDLLKPTLILKRKTQYKLNCQNTIDLLLQVSDNGWTTSETFIEWIEQIVVPHLQGRHGLLLLDSYEGHKSEKVKQFVVQNHPNIHCCVIPGGYTDILQPLDLGINAAFKRTCKEESLNFINQKTLDLYRDQTEQTPLNFNLMIGMIIFITF